jgi:hypothetical protein
VSGRIDDVGASNLDASIRSKLLAIASGNIDPYEGGVGVWKTATASPADSAGSKLMLLWLGLTDNVEATWEDAHEARATMVESAAQWVALRNDHEAEDDYFARWFLRVFGTANP